jgi:hypothetical protein
MTNAEIARHFQEAGLSILHLAAITRWTVPDILAACMSMPETLAVGYRAGLEDALVRRTTHKGS